MQIVDNTYQIADGYFISNYISDEAFEAENLIFPVLLIVMGLLGVLMTALCFTLAEPISRFFVGKHTEELISLSIDALKLVSVSFLFSGITTYCSSYFTGLNQGTASLIISLVKGVAGPPQMYTVLKKLYGPLPLEYVLMMGEKYNGEEEAQPGVWEGYGTSEACPPVLLNPAGKGGPLCLGKPAARTKVYVVDEEGNRIDQPGEIGELCISSPWLALGYHNMPRETAERFTENPFEPGTHLYHSGDQMAWDENGNLVFHGRRDRIRPFTKRRNAVI